MSRNAFNRLDRERLLHLLAYEPDTGLFRWRLSRACRGSAGQVAGSTNRAGYVEISVDERKYLAHRLAWLFVHGEHPSLELDHLNGIRNDNRIANLRLATRTVNNQNRTRPQATNRLGFLGVSPDRARFRAQIQVAGKKLHVGTFDTPEEAHSAYVAAKRKLHEGSTL